MNAFKNKKVITITFGLVILYLITRLTKLTDFPMLNDESIYLHWAQQMLDNPKNLMIPLHDGRQPLFIWMISWYMKLIHDPLVAGRLVSVSAGLATMAGIFAVTKEIFRKNEYGITAAVLYIVSPFALVYDRLALLDSLVAAFTIWSIYFTIILAKRLTLDTAYTLGLVVGGGIITKSNGVFALYLLPLSIVLLSFKHNKKVEILVRWVILLIVVYLMSQLMNAIITTTPEYSRILDVNQIFIIPKREFLTLPIGFIISNFFHNLLTLLGYFAWYFTFSYLILLCIASFDTSFWREKLFLILYFLVPLLVFSLFARMLLPRYIYFMTVSLFPLCAYGAVMLYRKVIAVKAVRRLKNKLLVQGIYVSLLLILPIYMSCTIINDIRAAAIPNVEKEHYAALEHPFVNESIKVINIASKNKKVLLAIEGYIGWAPNMYQVLLHDNMNVTIKAYPHIDNTLPQEIVASANEMPTYVIIPRPEGNAISNNFPVTKIVDKKVVLISEDSPRNYFLRMYKVTP